MALLTAEDVLNKAFSKTKYREGFDQDEVDDFLDEVANAISALTAERDELQTRLSQYQAGGAPVAAAPVATAPVAAASPRFSSASADLLAAATDPNPPSATTMLSMAQKLHDDYVQAGESERDRIIGEGKVKAESIVEQAETDARVRMQSLDSDRADLERRIDDLRRFERDYRGHLRNYLENLLGDLEHNSARGGVSAPGVDGPGVDGTRFDGPRVDAPGAVAPMATPEPPPLFGGAFADAQPASPQEPAVYPRVVPETSFGALAHAETVAPAAQPVVPVHRIEVSEAAPLPTFSEELPPFPDTSPSVNTLESPFRDANPFPPSAAPVEPQPHAVADSAPAFPARANPEEEAPRWNF